MPTGDMQDLQQDHLGGLRSAHRQRQGARTRRPVVTIDGDDQRIRISAPAGTTPGTYAVTVHGSLELSAWQAGWYRYTYTIEVLPAEPAPAP